MMHGIPRNLLQISFNKPIPSNLLFSSHISNNIRSGKRLEIASKASSEFFTALTS